MEAVYIGVSYFTKEYSPMSLRHFFIFGMIFLLAACQPGNQPIQKEPKGRNTTPSTESDGTYELFMDSLLHGEGILYADSGIEAGEVWEWSDEKGSYPKEPAIFHFGKSFFRMDRMRVVNEKGDRPFNISYSADTAFVFTFRNKKYGWAEAGYRDCNGSGCLERFYFLGDFEQAQLHLFVTMAVPQGPRYFGDFNGDDQLDFLIPEYLDNDQSKLPYSDTTEYLTLTAYTLDKQGGIKSIRRSGKECTLTGRFDGGNFAPQNFRIIGTTYRSHDY